MMADCKKCVRDGVSCIARCLEKYRVEQPELSDCGCFKDRTKYVERESGQWIEGGFENSKKCSVCGKYATKIHVYSEPVFDYVFCPYCGADLRGGDSNEIHLHEQ